MKHLSPSSHELRYQQGSGIIEILIATLVVGLVLTSVAAVLTLSLQNTGQNRLRAIAQTRAQEGIETFRRYRDELGWLAFSAQFPADTTTTYCLDPLPTSAQEFSQLAAGPCDTPIDIVGSPFYREVEVTPVGTSPVTSVEVRMEVRWLDGNRERSVTLFQILQNI